FLVVELCARRPLLDLSLFRRQGFAGANGVGLLLTAVMCSVFLPLALPAARPWLLAACHGPHVSSDDTAGRCRRARRRLDRGPPRSAPAARRGVARSRGRPDRAR